MGEFMNIFYLDKDPLVAASYHNDKHCVKMILESAQMLSTAHRLLDDNSDDLLYKASYKNHPCTRWVRDSLHHYHWLYRLFNNLGKEYTQRYNKTHLTIDKLSSSLSLIPKNIPTTEFVEPPQCMPEYCKVEGDSVAAYRNYYISEKSSFCVWKKPAVTPAWFIVAE